MTGQPAPPSAPPSAQPLAQPPAQRDIRGRVAGGFLRLINPLVRRMVSRGIPTGAPNVLLTVRGRRSGRLRTVPVGMVVLDGRRFVQSSYGETGWVANLRAAGEAIMPSVSSGRSEFAWTTRPGSTPPRRGATRSSSSSR